MKFKPGDKVSVLDDSFTGTVKSYKKDGKVAVITAEGFELLFTESELIPTGGSLGALFAGKSLGSVLREKETPVKRKQPVPEKKSRKDSVVLEIDLHVEKLVRNKKGMSNYDILNLQMDTARHHLEYAIKNRIPRIVFIHGVGEGVLKSELDYLLGRYEEVVFGDANYQKYGLGATEVYIKQNPGR
ncbi:Smr/MutS family protein [Flavobacterium sp. RHBU_3]|uniref:Smr/MutS family protein n=1 Tax=Flavobacterium sp. RHBU_3 TaxID=3391184 RepID=UPI00398508D5